MKRAIALGGLLAALLLLAAPTPAGAHAELRETTPRDRAVLDEPPPEIRLRFTESVDAGGDAIKVLDHHGSSMLGPDTAQPKGSVLTLPVPDDLPDGPYVVTWRVTSVDSHPIQGSFTFRVGDPASQDFHTDGDLVAGAGGSRAVGVALGTARFATFAGLALLAGGLAFVLVLWPAGLADRRWRRVVWTAWVVAVASTVAGVLLQGPYARGRGFGDVLSGDSMSLVLDTRFGRAWVFRLGLLLLIAYGVGQLTRVRRVDRVLAGSVGAALAASLATVSLAGHAATGPWVAAAVPLDVVHLGAVSFWLGGLVVLAVCVLSGPGADEPAALTSRFSHLAWWSVIAVVTTGVVQALRQVDAPAQLVDTSYGRLLLAKLAAFVVLLGLAGLARRWVGFRLALPAAALSPGPGARAAEDDPRRAALRRTVLAEVAIAVGILAVTAALVNAVPARAVPESGVTTGLFTAEMNGDGVVVSVTVEPARRGLNDVHLYLIDDAGSPLDAVDVTATLRLESAGVAPIELPLSETAPGHTSAFGVDIPIAGDWDLEVAVLVSEFDQVTTRTTVPIR